MSLTTNRLQNGIDDAKERRLAQLQAQIRANLANANLSASLPVGIR